MRVNGRRAVLMSIQKVGAASTLNIVNEIQNRLPRVAIPLSEAPDVVLDLSVPAVKSVLFRARTELRSRLSKYLD